MTLAKRQEHFQKGRNAEEKGDLIKAIEEYELYRTYLLESDNHVPLRWLSNMIYSTGNIDVAEKYILEYCDKCKAKITALDALQQFIKRLENDNHQDKVKILKTHLKELKKMVANPE